MNIISTINLNNDYDVTARDIQDTANIFEYSGMIQLKSIFDYIEKTDQAVSYNIANGKYSLSSNKGVARQTLLNSFDINEAKVLEDFNTYRNLFVNTGTNINIPNLTPTISPVALPPRFIIMDDLGSQIANINAAQNGTDGVNRRHIATVGAKYKNALGEQNRDILIKVYETYIKQSDNHIIYYRWHHYLEANGTTHIAYVSQSYNGIEIIDETFTSPVLLIDDGDWIGLTNHGIPAGSKVKFNSIVTTTGLNSAVEYTVASAAITEYETDRFKIKNSFGQTVQFTNDGTANLIFSREALLSF
jgi:hypothetical protein